MTARRLARELAVIMMPQLPRNKSRLEALEFDTLLCKSVQMLTDHARQCLSEADGYVQKAHQELSAVEMEHPTNARKIADIKPVPIKTDELRRQLELIETAMHLVTEALDIPEMAISSDHVPDTTKCNKCGHTQHLSLRRAGSADVKKFLESLLSVYLDHSKEIDQIIGAIKTKWRMDRMVSIDRDILRLSCAEAFFMPEVPLKVAISEGVELAHRFADDRAAKFINGVLADMVVDAENFRASGELKLNALTGEGQGQSEQNNTPVRG